MKIIGVIPARYASSRFPGKPLADICGKPMIWWVYQQAIKAQGISEVYVATDDARIREKCMQEKMNVVMTSIDCKTHLERLYEVSIEVESDFYININGDEPLIESHCIEDLLPPESVKPDTRYAANGMMILDDPIDAIDSSKIKIATDMFGNGLYASRNPIPFPKGRSDYQLKKFVGIQCFTKKSLEFCFNTNRGFLESIEDIDEFRFIENGHPLKFILTTATTLAVDTPKDLEKVRVIIQKKIDAGQIML
jgi:3-deoxy-manno-octulosonate cytidylyltransferase (CMP-KDO synthetase)